MKILIPLLVYMISLYANPSWFLHLSSSVGTNTYIGYGVGVSASEAKREALTDRSENRLNETKRLDN